MNNEHPTILALDEATKTGFALYFEGKYLSGSWQLPPPDGNANEEGARFLSLADHLHRVSAKTNGIDIILYEVVKSHKSAYQAHLFGGWIAVIQMWAHVQRRRNEVETPRYHPLMASEVKKFATGKGTANKDAMKAAAWNPQKQLIRPEFKNVDPDDEDAIDAMWILLCGMDHKRRGVLGKKRPKPKPRKKRAKAVKKANTGRES